MGAMRAFILGLTVRAAAANIVTLDELNSALDATGGNKRVAFLTQANYDAVHTVLSSNAEVVICDGSDVVYSSCTSTSAIIGHVIDDTFLAGLISGLPDAISAPSLNSFSSTVVSLRAMFMAPVFSDETPHGTLTSAKSAMDLSFAVDAAIVTLQSTGTDEKVRQSNMPFEFIAAHTCRIDDPSLYTVPNFAAAQGLLRTTLDNRILKVGALGPYDWGGNDGNYKVDPPVGFYPDWLTEFCNVFNSLKGPDGVRYNSSGNITCERVYQPSSASVFQDLFGGASYVTEPYYIVDSFYTGTGESCATSQDCRQANLESEREYCQNATGGADGDLTCQHPSSPRFRHFRLSCSTIGVDSTFMTKRDATSSPSPAPDQDSVVTDAAYTVDGLNAALQAGVNKKVAFLSQANYDAVQTVLDDSVEVVICDTSDATYADCSGTDDMIHHILQGDFVAGLISGLPESHFDQYLNIFSSTVVSLRSMFMSPVHSTEMVHGTTEPSKSSEDLSLAVDAAIVRLQADGKDEEAKLKNAPFEFIIIHTCRTTDPSLFIAPNSVTATGLLRTVLDDKSLKIGALGPYDWGGNDGNYKVDPPVGFYPDWLTAFCENFNALAGPDGVRYDANGTITCDRVYQPSSSAVFKDLFDGVSYVTEPYYTVDASYTGTGEDCSADSDCRVANLAGGHELCQVVDVNTSTCAHPTSPRTRHFRQSCSTIGIDSTFMVAKNFTLTPIDSGDDDKDDEVSGAVPTVACWHSRMLGALLALLAGPCSL
jgi:hypothetical protein